jgi:hypothetical protein
MRYAVLQNVSEFPQMFTASINEAMMTLTIEAASTSKSQQISTNYTVQQPRR